MRWCRWQLVTRLPSEETVRGRVVRLLHTPASDEARKDHALRAVNWHGTRFAKSANAPSIRSNASLWAFMLLQREIERWSSVH